MEDWLKEQWEMLCKVRDLVAQGKLEPDVLELHERAWIQMNQLATPESHSNGSGNTDTDLPEDS